MAFNVTKSLKLASRKVNLEPQMVLEIDGVATRYGVTIIDKRTRIGDAGLVIGGGWRIGGRTPLADQASLISFSAGTTTSIQQQLDPSKGAGSSISSLQIALVDKNKQISKLVSPGLIVDDMLGRRARIYIGLQDTSFPEDYITIFRGIVDDIQMKAGAVILDIAAPDQKKRQTLFTKHTVTATAVSGSSIYFDRADFLNIFYGSTSGVFDAHLTTYLKYGEEYIKVSRGLPRWDTSTTLPYTIVARAQLGSAMNPNPIATGSQFDTFYVLEGNSMDLALAIMLSDPDQTPYLKDLPILSITVTTSPTPSTAVLFKEDIQERYGVSVGDAISIFGTTSNDTGYYSYPNQPYLETILDIVKTDQGTLVYIGTNFHSSANEIPTAGTARFLSKYNFLGAGLKMLPDECDIQQHEYLKKTFLSSFNYRFYLKDSENMKDFIEQEIYLPAGAYSLPRKSKASVGLHTGPIPGAQGAIITKDDVPKPSELIVRRSIATNFANTIIYQWDQALNSTDFGSGLVQTDEDSINRIKVGTKAMTIQSRGMRDDLNAITLAIQASKRRLNRYKFAAEYIEKIQVTFKKGFALEIGDVVLLNADGLGLINTKDGNRSPKPRLYEIVNKTVDFKTGVIDLSIVDTNYSLAVRYGLISPSSLIRVGISNTKFVIQSNGTSGYGTAEYLKWTRFLEGKNTVGVKVRSPDFTTRIFQTTIKAIIGNEIEVNDDLGFTPQFGDVLEFANYDFVGTTDTQKALYAYMKDTAFADGGKQYGML